MHSFTDMPSTLGNPKIPLKLKTNEVQLCYVRITLSFRLLRMLITTEFFVNSLAVSSASTFVQTAVNVYRLMEGEEGMSEIKLLGGLRISTTSSL